MEESKILEEQIKNAPPEIKKLLVEGKWSITLEEIARKHNLVNEQLGSFENEVLFVLLGMEPITNLVQSLRDNIGLTGIKAMEIYQEVYTSILREVESLLPTKVEEGEMPVPEIKPDAPELPPDHLPMVEPGETVHDAKPMTEAEKSSIPKTQQQTWARKPWSPSEQTYKYPGGKDPYREPLV